MNRNQLLTVDRTFKDTGLDFNMSDCSLDSRFRNLSLNTVKTPAF